MADIIASTASFSPGKGPGHHTPPGPPPATHADMVHSAVLAARAIVGSGLTTDVNQIALALLNDKSIRDMLISVSRLSIFNNEMTKVFNSSEVSTLGTLKQLKYFHALPKAAVATLIAQLAESHMSDAYTHQVFGSFRAAVATGVEQNPMLEDVVNDLELSDIARAEFRANAAWLAEADSQVVYSTSMDRAVALAIGAREALHGRLVDAGCRAATCH